MPQKKVTIYDVAHKAGASISTVSRVLNKSPLVTESTAQRVWDAVEELNYRPSSLARALASNETRTIGLILTDNMNPFFAELAYHIESAGAETGYSVILCNSDRDPVKEAAHVNVLIDKRVDGVILMAVDTWQSHGNASMELLVQEQIPVVTFDRTYESFDSVVLDNYQGGYEATQHLIDLEHTRIACITGPGSVVGSAGRVGGYRQALADADLPARPEWVVAGGWSYESGRRALHAIFGGGATATELPDGLFVCNDTMAIGALAGLAELGLAVPDDVSVIGFDDIRLSRYTVPPLTTIRTPIAEVGRTLCRLLVDRIAGTLPNEAQWIPVDCELVIRGTTTHPNPA